MQIQPVRCGLIFVFVLLLVLLIHYFASQQRNSICERTQLEVLDIHPTTTPPATTQVPTPTKKVEVHANNVSHRLLVHQQLWGMQETDSWTHYFDILDEDRLAPLTKFAQQWIYQQLHPPKSECRSRKAEICVL